MTDTTDENPERVAIVQQLTTAYLRSALYQGDASWTDVTKTLADTPDPQGRVDQK